MAAEQPTDEQLMRHFDGELTEAEAEAVTARIDADADYKAKYRALENMHRAVDASVSAVTANVDFDALYSRIEHGITQEAAAQSPAKQATHSAAQSPAPGLMERIGSWLSGLGEHPGQLWVPAAGIAAAAVVVFVVARSGTPQETARLPKPPPTEDRSDLPPAPAPVALASSEVVQVDFGENTGTVFEIALAEGVSTPVVWINDEE